MIRSNPKPFYAGQCALLLAGCMLVVLVAPRAAAEETPLIDEAIIRELHADHRAAASIRSTVEKRRALRRIAQRAAYLVKQHPAAPNRFQALSAAFNAQKGLMILKSDRGSQEALLETAGQLMKAPDAYARERLPAEILLMQVDFSRTRASKVDRIARIRTLVEGYRDTPAEAQSLMTASTFAHDLGHAKLLYACREALSARFSHDPTVTAFLRERFNADTKIHFRGEFKRGDGKRIVFPIGQTYLVCFWSLDTPMLKERVAEVTAFQRQCKKPLKVFSFNLDELPDGGAGELARRQLKWIPVMLPDGAGNPLYRSVAGAHLFASVVIGPHGLASVDRVGGEIKRRGPANAPSEGVASLFEKYEAAAESPRLCALLRSLSTGEFLVARVPFPQGGSIPGPILAAIEDCFVPPPLRYRLTPAEELRACRKAEALCRKAVAGHAGDPGLWWVHNRRTVALLGMLRLTGEWGYLEQAVASARDALELDLPPGARVVPHFCLATETLMTGGRSPEQVLSTFIDAAGGQQPSGAVYAAALMLALELHSRDHYIAYRNILLNDFADDPSVARVVSLLFDRQCASRLFERALPNLGRDIDSRKRAAAGLRIDWRPLSIHGGRAPGAADGTVDALVFMEPTDDPDAAAVQQQVMAGLAQKAAERPMKDLHVTAVWLGRQPGKPAEPANPWVDVVHLSGTDWHSLAARAGLFQTDLKPNVYLVGPDGLSMLALSGVGRDTLSTERMVYLDGRFRIMRDSRGLTPGEYIITRLGEVLRNRDMVLADRALTANDLREYAMRLQVSLPPPPKWIPIYEEVPVTREGHRRKLAWAYMQLKELEKARVEITHNIPAIGNSQKKAGLAEKEQAVLMRRRALLLKQLERDADAQTAAGLAEAAGCPPEHEHEVRVGEPETMEQLAERLAEVEAPARARTGNPHTWFRRSDLAGDLVLRAEVLAHLGRAADADSDRRRAEALVWPQPPRKVDARTGPVANAYRRTRASELMDAGDLKEALAAISANIAGHDREPIRIGENCLACAVHVKFLQNTAKTLEREGREAEAVAVRNASRTLILAPGNDRELSPDLRNRLSWELKRHRVLLGKDLLLRAEILERLERLQEATKDRRRARGLSWPLDSESSSQGGVRQNGR